MTHFKVSNVRLTLVAAIALIFIVSCSDEDIAPRQPSPNSIPGKDVGIRQLKVSVPRLSRFDKMVDRTSCRIYLRGRKDRVTFPINSFMSADKDSIYLEADDPILTELPHQMYHLNAISFPSKNITARGDGPVQEDTVYLGARLSIEDPDNIHFRSSFNVGANTIGSGTEPDPWIVASGDDFMLRISDPMTRGESLDGQFFEITRNLNLNTTSTSYGKGWEPAGHNNINGGSTDFNGIIDGCDNYIENLYCFTDAGCGGLFYSLGENAYIHNIEMRRVMLNGNKDIGAFACFSKKGCRLDSIQVNGTIEGKENLGGLIGSGEADIRVCISSVDMSASSDELSNYIGGMIGRSDGATFTDCIRTGRIDAPNMGYVGGYVGCGPESDNGTVTFTRCYVAGAISGSENVGGFAGYSSVEFTECHAGATLPQDSYAYTLMWDIFNLNNMMTPVPLEVEGDLHYTGGFVGNAPRLTLHGENSFAYSSPAKPNIVSGQWTGSLAGKCVYYGDAGARFTSYAYVKGTYTTGGAIGYGDFQSPGTFINYGNVEGEDCVGGVIGEAYTSGTTFKANCKNSGNVKGHASVGGVIGCILSYVDNAVMENDGNVEGSGDDVGGLFGQSVRIDLADGSHVSNENGSLKISGAANVGGISGKITPDKDQYLSHKYCPIYANIISSGGCAGGIFGYARVYGSDSQAAYHIFDVHSPVRVSITVTAGDNVGGAIGYFIAEDGDMAHICDFDDKLQASISTTGNVAGGIVGRMVQDNNPTAILDSRSFATIRSTATSEVMGFGGLVGMCENRSAQSCDISVTSCSFHGSVSGANATAAGGIVGHGDDNLVVRYCYNNGRVDAVQAVGGIVGRIIGEGTIDKCFNMGEVPSAPGRTWLAGILGQKEDNNSDYVTISDCYNVGNTGWGIIGGENNSHITCSRCYYLDTASDGDMKNSGAQAKTADEMRRQATYPGWINGLEWDFHEDVAAPTLHGVEMLPDEKLPLQK